MTPAFVSPPLSLSAFTSTSTVVFPSSVDLLAWISAKSAHLCRRDACATQKWNIPFLILPTDLDGSTFLSGFPSLAMHTNLKVGLAYDDPDIHSVTFQHTKIPAHQLEVMGFPIRPACQKKYTAEELKTLRQKYELREHYHTVTLMMGALGGNLIFEHTKQLIHLDRQLYKLPLQFNICMGQNKKIGAKITTYLKDKGAISIGPFSYLLPSGMLFHIRPFTPAIIELMAASDVIITKTGSCTVNEALYLEKKLLLDNTQHSTARYLWWEKFNIPFVQKHHLGHAFTDSKQLNMLLPSLLNYAEKKESHFSYPNFKENIQKVVQKMMDLSISF